MVLLFIISYIYILLLWVVACLLLWVFYSCFIDFEGFTLPDDAIECFWVCMALFCLGYIVGLCLGLINFVDVCVYLIY